MSKKTKGNKKVKKKIKRNKILFIFFFSFFGCQKLRCTKPKPRLSARQILTHVPTPYPGHVRVRSMYIVWYMVRSMYITPVGGRDMCQKLRGAKFESGLCAP
jgi:hypothetical protein